MVKQSFVDLQGLFALFDVKPVLVEEKDISITVLPSDCNFRLVEQVDQSFDGLVLVVNDRMFWEIKKDKINNKLKDIFQYYEKYTDNNFVERCYYYFYWRRLAFYLNAPQEVKDRIVADTINSTIRRKWQYFDRFIAREKNLVFWLFQEGDDKESVRKATPKCTRVFFVDGKKINSLRKISCGDSADLAYPYLLPEEKKKILPYLTTDFAIDVLSRESVS